MSEAERPEPMAGEPAPGMAARPEGPVLEAPREPVLEPAPAPLIEPAAPPRDATSAPTHPLSQPGADAGAAVYPVPPLGSEPPPAPELPLAAGPPIPLVTTRGLLPAAFDLLLRSSEDMRRASFYIGAVTLGTVGPLGLAVWALVVAGETISYPSEFDAPVPTDPDVVGPVALLGSIAMIGFLVAAIESRTLATAVLGGQMRGRPIPLRQAVTRARARFWPAVGASLVVGIVLSICQGAVNALLAPVLGAGAAEATIITSTILTATVGAPFAYVLCGVVLGDVGALESIRRSSMVARARWGAAAIIVTFETATALLILFGFSAGADIVGRAFGVLGIGPDSGSAGLAIATLMLVAGVFAVGTLLYTVTALTVAPQVVMFVGLTHATIGLDRIDRTARGRFFSVPMLIGVAVAIFALISVVVSV